MSIPSGWELVLLLGVLVVLFGATKLPTAARSIGQSMRIFKAEMGTKDEAPEPSPQQKQSLPPSGTAATGSSETRTDGPRVEQPEESRPHNDTTR